ncbi:hypothetical protein [Bacillus sp. m3-13]|uniref:hypothetical protein n=1 Tax=Bacillus sp. m3-13 TaxID=406124 RepID=UPI0001E89CBA|nr:hypothetical protein [Bacillus sp. m3-13]
MDLLKDEEKEKVIVNYLSAYGKTLESEGVSLISEHPQSNNPIFLRTLLDEIRVYGELDPLGELRSYLGAETVIDLFIKKLNRLERDYNTAEQENLVEDLLTILWCSRSGFSESVIQDILGKGEEKLYSHVWSPLFLAIESNIVNNGSHIYLFHQYLRDAVEKKYFMEKGKKEKVHQRIVDHFSKADMDSHFTEIPWQLMKAKNWERLYSLLQNLNLLNKLWEYDRFEAQNYWEQIEENTKPWKKTKTKDLTMLKGYQSIISTPEAYKIKDVELIATLLEGKHPDEALKLQMYMKKHFEQKEEFEWLHKCIIRMAIHLKNKGEMDEALSLLKEQELRTTDLAMLQEIIGIQAEVLSYWGRYEDSMILLKQQESICLDNIGLEGGLHQSYGNQAIILQRKHRIDEAMDLLREKERICTEIGDKVGLQDCLGIKGRIYKSQGSLVNALEMFNLQEEICRNIGKLNSLQSCLNYQAACLYEYNTNNIDIVIAKLKEQEVICTSLNHRDGLQMNYALHARILLSGRKFDSALNKLKSQESICRDLNNNLALQECLGRQVSIYKNKYKIEKAKELLLEQEKICRRHEYKLGLQIALGNKSDLLQREGKVLEALECAKEQAEICKEIQNETGLYYSYRFQSYMLLRFGKVEESLALNKLMEEISVKNNMKEEYNQVIYERASIYAGKRDYEKALALYRKSKEISESLENARNYEHATLSENKILGWIDMTEPFQDDEDTMDYYTISPTEKLLLYIIQTKKDTVFKGIIEALELVGMNLSQAKVNKFLYILKKKALTFTVKTRVLNKNKVIYRLTDLGEQRMSTVSLEELEQTLQISLKERDIILPNAIKTEEEQSDNSQFLLSVRDLIAKDIQEVEMDNQYFFVKQYMNADGAKFGKEVRHVLVINSGTVSELQSTLELLSNQGVNTFYLIAESDRLLHDKTMVNFYTWLKQKYNGNIRAASGDVHVHITTIDKYEENGWKKVYFGN